MEVTYHKTVSQKGSFQFLSEDISFFSLALSGLPNITLQIPQEQSLRKASRRESCNSVNELTEHKAGSQTASFQFLTEDISFFTLEHFGLRNITLQIPEEQC